MKVRNYCIGLLAAATCGLLLTGITTPAKSTSLRRSTTSSYPSFGINIPVEYETHGIDVSRHQKTINWDAVSRVSHREVNIDFAFIKASEGKTVVDNYFDENWKAAKENGIIRGAYHFFRPHLGAEEQASLFIRQVPKLYKGDLPPVLDIEMRGRCPKERLRKNIYHYLVLMEKHYGIKPIIYTNYGFYKHHLTGKEFRKYPLWIAHYKTNNINSMVDRWHFWQHTDKARVDGIIGAVDFNVFNGSLDDLKELCKK